MTRDTDWLDLKCHKLLLKCLVKATAQDKAVVQDSGRSKQQVVTLMDHSKKDNKFQQREPSGQDQPQTIHLSDLPDQ